MADAVYTVEIEGVERDVLLTSIDLRMTADGVTVLTFDLDSEDASYRPNLDEVVVLKENGTPRFKGFLTSAKEEAHGGPALDSIVTRCSAAAQDVVLTYRYITLTIPGGSTLKQALQQIDADPENYFSGWDLSLAAGQANGPTLDADVTFTRVRLDEAIKRLAELTGYIPEVSAADEFEMYAPGSRSAPGNLLATGAVHQVGDVLIEPTRDDTFVNRIILTITGAGPAQSTETITFDGNAVFTYTAKYPAPIDANTVWPNVIYLASDGGERGGPIGFNDGSSAWQWVTAVGQRARLVLNGAGLVPALGDTFTITYDIAFPFDVVVEALGSPPSHIREIVLQQPEGMTFEEAIAWATSLLNRKNTTLKTARFESHTIGWAPGQTLTINLPKRNVNATFLIQEVVMRPDTGGWFKDDNGDERLMRYEITAVEGDVNQGDWRNTPRSWLGDGNEGTLQTAGTGARPGGDIYDVQTHGASHDFFGSGYVREDFDLGGDAYGPNAKTARLAVKTINDDQSILALFNAALSNAEDRALTFTQGDNGTFDIELESGAGLNIVTYGAGIGGLEPRIKISSAESITSEAADKYVDYVQTKGTHAADGLAVRDYDWASGSITVDDSGTLGNNPYTLFRYRGSTSVTVNLPAIAAASARVASVATRLLMVVHDGTAGTLTIDPNSTETIGNGSAAASTFALTVGQSVICALVSGTGGGVKVIASHGMGTGSPGGSNTHIQYNDSSALGGDANLTWDKTKQQFQVQGDTADDDATVRIANESTNQSVIALQASNGVSPQITFGREFVGGVDTARHARPAILSKDATDMWMEMGIGETPGSAMAFPSAVGMGFTTNGAYGYIYSYGLGTGAVPGSAFEIGRNADGNGAAGSLKLVDKAGTAYYLWVEAGKLRIHTSPPTENNTTVSHTAGTVVGNQT